MLYIYCFFNKGGMPTILLRIPAVKTDTFRLWTVLQVNASEYVKPKGNLRHMVSKAISKLLLGNCDTLNRISIHEFPLICHIVNVGLTGRSLPGLSD